MQSVEKFTFVKIGQNEVALDVKACVGLWYVADRCLGWEKFQVKLVEKVAVCFMSITSSENRAIFEITTRNTINLLW